MRSLRADAGVSPDGHNEKPFTLHFEELLNSFRRRARESHPGVKRRNIDLQFKSIIADKMRRLEPDEVHGQLMRLPVANVLTTNYDFCLERAFRPGAKARRLGYGRRAILPVVSSSRRTG